MELGRILVRRGADRLVGGLIVILLLMVAVGAETLLQPDANLTPRQVVEIQLRSLQQNDVPAPDNGIAQTWAFAHPANREMTGPLARFTVMLKGPNYRRLLNHRSHRIEPVVRTDDMALFNVAIVAADGVTLLLQWRVARVGVGRFTGAWMTVGVSPPLKPGDAV